MPSPPDSGDIEVDPARLAGWLADDASPQLIDVREAYERDAGHIGGSRHIPMAELAAEAASMERSRAIVFYCRVGARSLMAAQAFRASGFEAYTMTGGLLRWAGEGRPIAPDGGHVADH